MTKKLCVLCVPCGEKNDGKRKKNNEKRIYQSPKANRQ